MELDDEVNKGRVFDCPNYQMVVMATAEQVEAIYHQYKKTPKEVESYLKSIPSLTHLSTPISSIGRALENSWGKINFDKEIVIKWIDYWTFMRSCKTRKKCLIVVDVQNDFLTGSLATSDNYHQVIQNINSLLQAKHSKFDVVVYSKDWHPPTHISLYSNHKRYNGVSASNGIIKMYEKCVFQLPAKYGGETLETTLWPNHCVIGSVGAQLSSDLFIATETPATKVLLIEKGTNPVLESYSVFQDTLKFEKTPLLGVLLDNRITDVYVCGCVAEVCVIETAIDSMKFNFNTFFVKDATVYLNPANKKHFPESHANLNVISTHEVWKPARGVKRFATSPITTKIPS